MRRLALRTLLVVLIAAIGAFGWKTRDEAHTLVTNPRATRKVATVTPADRQMPFEAATVTTADGFRLLGWFVPAVQPSALPRPATVMLVHGYKDHRGSLLGVADILHRNGYSALLLSLRGHDENDGELISFGLREMADLDAWLQYLRGRPDVDPGRIALYGASMGGTIGIGWAAGHPNIRAVITDGAFSSVSDTAATSIKFFTGLPAFPFAPAIVFWMEREIGGNAADLDATRWIPKIAPRPILLMQGGADTVVSAESGRKLFDAAGEPKELWFEPAVGHTQFLKMMPDQFEEHVIRFLARVFGKD
jgi:alpha-beta hydrolase superfamily lysophospholipase